jgi:hypothetical protein
MYAMIREHAIQRLRASFIPQTEERRRQEEPPTMATYGPAQLRRIPVPFDQLAARAEGEVTRALIAHLSGALQVSAIGTNPIIFGDPPVVILVARLDAAELYEPRVEWPLPSQPRLSGLWRRTVPASASDAVLLAQVLRVARRRQSRYRVCADCRTTRPPEHLVILDRRPVCHRCAERHHGVVF